MNQRERERERALDTLCMIHLFTHVHCSCTSWYVITITVNLFQALEKWKDLPPSQVQVLLLTTFSAPSTPRP
jgi:hypothetical protein